MIIFFVLLFALIYEHFNCLQNDGEVQAVFDSSSDGPTKEITKNRFDDRKYYSNSDSTRTDSYLSTAVRDVTDVRAVAQTVLPVTVKLSTAKESATPESVTTTTITATTTTQQNLILKIENDIPLCVPKKQHNCFPGGHSSQAT